MKAKLFITNFKEFAEIFPVGSAEHKRICNHPHHMICRVMDPLN